MSLPRKPHHKGFKPRQKPLTRKTEMPRGNAGLARKTPMQRGAPPKRTAIKPVSAKRQREQRERVKMIKAETGGAPVACERCDRAEAVDPHEIVPRSQGGSITDRANVRFICRDCHDWIHDNPREATADGWLARATLDR